MRHKEKVSHFNTDLNSPPIYVVDPSEFHVKPDTDIPIILAYNMSHYESMEPCTDADVITTVNLVKEYQEGRYGFTKKDLPFLFGIKESNDAENAKSIILQKQNRKNINDNGLDQFKHSDDSSSDKLCYKLRGAKMEYCFVEKDGKIECPFCKLLVKNIKLHLNKNVCINEIDYAHFEVRFNVYQKAKQQRMNKEKKDRWKENNPELSKEKNKMYKQTYTKKDPEEARRKNRENNRKSRNIQIEQNPVKFQKKHLNNVIKSQRKKKEQNPLEYQKQNQSNIIKAQKKKKEQNPDEFKKRNLENAVKSQNKLKAEDSQGFKREQLENSQKSKKKRKEENETEFRKKNLENAKKSQQKQKDKNLQNHNAKKSKASKRH